MELPPNPSVFDAFSTEMVQSSDGRQIIVQRHLIKGGVLQPVFPMPAPVYLGIGRMQLPGPPGQPPLQHEFTFEIEGAGDLVDAFALYIVQLQAAGKKEHERILAAGRRQSLTHVGR